MPQWWFFLLDAFKFQTFIILWNSKLWTISKIRLEFGRRLFWLSKEQRLYEKLRTYVCDVPTEPTLAQPLLKWDCYYCRCDFLALPFWHENNTDFFGSRIENLSGNESNGWEKCIGTLLKLSLLKYTRLTYHFPCRLQSTRFVIFLPALTIIATT